MVTFGATSEITHDRRHYSTLTI